MNESGYWDSVALEWQRKSHDPLWRDHADAVNLRLLARWLPSAQRLLKTDLFDEAVAHGLYTILRTHAAIVIGMDLSLVTAAVARRRSAGDPVTCADVRHLPFPDAAFDCIVSDSTLDHFASPGDLMGGLRELHRVLRPGGTLLVTLDNLANPLVALRNALPFRVLNRLGLVPYYVGASCGPRRLRRFLHEVGFECREMDAILHSPRVLAVWMARLFDRLGSPTAKRTFLAWLMSFEALTKLPTRFWTGYFVAARAVRKAETR